MKTDTAPMFHEYKNSLGTYKLWDGLFLSDFLKIIQTVIIQSIKNDRRTVGTASVSFSRPTIVGITNVQPLRKKEDVVITVLYQKQAI